MSAEQATGELPLLTPEQWEAGRGIAELCGFGKDILNQYMVWREWVATVEYGLAHSAEYIDYLTIDEVRGAVYSGIARYQAMQNNPE